MSIPKVLASCMKIEQSIGQIYQYLADLFAKEAAFHQLFSRLAADEQDHALQIKLAGNLQRETVVTGLHLDETKVEELLSQVREMVASLRGTPPTAAEALQMALRLEEEFCQTHLLAAADIRDEKLASMFRALARADKDHLGQLQKFCVAYEKARGVKILPTTP
ncbi:MAG: hypothetical protein C0621_04250 [Desulfuromonas sp.]|nr:MAG: hypothetical protein C0621_04250 [Desulfuromonas sp.]